MSGFGLDEFGAALAALSALSAASFGLLDASKGLWGGISHIGLGHIRRALTPFKDALASAVGEDRWWGIVQANWINGMAKDDQKAVARALVKLGLTPATAPGLAAAVKVDADALTKVAQKLASGEALLDPDLNLLGRLNAVLDTLLDSGFERADQQYKNVNRLLAGAVAVGLALVARLFWPKEAGTPPSFSLAFGIGLLAVPVAPVAKDLTSALSAAMKALKAAKAV